MADKFQNKYRIKSTRLQYWDYSRSGFYFVTICTNDRKCYFGNIIKRKSSTTNINIKNVLTEIGKIAEKYWIEIPKHFPFVKLDAFVIMPNHVHGIIIIDRRDNVKTPNIMDIRNVETPNIMDIRNVETPKLGVSTKPTDNTTKNKKHTGGKNDKWKSGTLGSIINQYKRICTINARKINPDFAWQSRFYDRIIRDKKAYQNIVKYIIENPLNWKDDKFYPI